MRDFPEHPDGEGRVRVDTLLRLAVKPKMLMTSTEATRGSSVVISWCTEEFQSVYPTPGAMGQTLD